MESLEQMRLRLTSLNEQKVTAEKSSDIDYAKELAVEIKELENQIATLPVSEENLPNLNEEVTASEQNGPNSEEEVTELPKSTVKVIDDGTEDVGDKTLTEIYKMYDQK